MQSNNGAVMKMLDECLARDVDRSFSVLAMDDANDPK